MNVKSPVSDVRYIVMSSSEASRFLLQHDREYFSKPVAVRLVESDGDMCIVHDPMRGHTYKAQRKNLRSYDQLTNKQRETVAESSLRSTH